MKVKLIGQWKEFASFLDPQAFARRLKANLRTANGQIGGDGVRRVHAAIRAGRFTPLAPSTLENDEGSPQPLIDTGRLLTAISAVYPDDETIRIGLHGDGEIQKIGIVQHEGATIKIGLRRKQPLAPWLAAHRALLSAAKGQKRTSVIVIPPRPFLAGPLSDPGFAKVVRKHWENAALAAFRGRRL